MSNQIQKSFGKALLEYRCLLGISQEELANLSALHRTYIGSVERGERNISLLNIVRISSALKIPPSEMLRKTMELYNEEGH